MAHFALLWKARTIEKYRQNYENEKYLSIQETKTPIARKSLSQRLRCYRQDTQKKFSKMFQKIYPEGSSLSHFFLFLKTDQTCLNFVLKSLLGFFIGLALTYLCYLFLVFQLSITVFNATIVSSVIGVLLTMGLAFSYRIRCLIFLLLPQFFSRAGRYTLTCYALVLILTGPATNTLKNSEVLTGSMACRQEQIKGMVKEVKHVMTKPLNSMRESIQTMVDDIRQFAKQMKQKLLKVNRLTLSVLETIQSSFLWLQWLSEVCNKKLGSPYERCMKVLGAEANSLKRRSKHKRTEKNNYLAEIYNQICSKLKKYKAICVFTDFVTGSYVTSIRRRLKDFTQRIRDMLYLKIHVRHTFSTLFFNNTSDSDSQVAAGIITEIRKRADPLLTWLSWSSCVTSLFLLLIIFRAKYYQHMFETRSCFDNKFITKELRDLDLNTMRLGKETILPLNRRERSKYVSTTSFRLVASEKIHLNRSIIFMTITTFKLLIHMVADYSLYWVLMTIQLHGKSQTAMPVGVPNAGMEITGKGRVADMFRFLLMALTSPLEIHQQLTSACLPNPNPPDFQRYTQIGILIFLLWFLSLFEPYGLRLRHVVMGLYRPERAKERAEWLFNHILKIRGGFMKFARRKLHRAYKYRSEERHTFKRLLNRYFPSWLRYILRISKEEDRCLLCGTKEIPGDANTILQMCDTDDCPGMYCGDCFSDIGEFCPICSSPSDYGDLSDVSFENGSSGESGDDLDEEESDTAQNDDHMDQDISDNDSSDILFPKPLRDKEGSQTTNRKRTAYINLNNMTYTKQTYKMNANVLVSRIKSVTIFVTSRYNYFNTNISINNRPNKVRSWDNNRQINGSNIIKTETLKVITQTEHNMDTETKQTTNDDKSNNKKKTDNNNQSSKNVNQGKKYKKNNDDETDESYPNTSKSNNNKNNDKNNNTGQDEIVKSEGNSLSYFNRMNTLIYAFWPNMKISLLNIFKHTSQDIIKINVHDDKNFKTRKKDEKFDRRIEEANARQYRILSYLAEQDWVIKKTISYKATKSESSLLNFKENPYTDTIELIKNDTISRNINLLNNDNKKTVIPPLERQVYVCDDCRYFCMCPGNPTRVKPGLAEIYPVPKWTEYEQNQNIIFPVSEISSPTREILANIEASVCKIHSKPFEETPNKKEVPKRKKWFIFRIFGYFKPSGCKRNKKKCKKCCTVNQTTSPFATETKQNGTQYQILDKRKGIMDKYEVEQKTNKHNAGRRMTKNVIGEKKDQDDVNREKSTHNFGQKRSPRNVERKENTHNVERKENTHNVKRKKNTHNVESKENTHNDERKEDTNNVERKKNIHNVERKKSTHNVERKEKPHNVERKKSPHNVERKKNTNNVERNKSPHNVERKENRQNDERKKNTHNVERKENTHNIDQGNTHNVERKKNTPNVERKKKHDVEPKNSKHDVGLKKSNHGADDQKGDIGEKQLKRKYKCHGEGSLSERCDALCPEECDCGNQGIIIGKCDSLCPEDCTCNMKGIIVEKCDSLCPEDCCCGREGTIVEKCDPLCPDDCTCGKKGIIVEKCDALCPEHCCCGKEGTIVEKCDPLCPEDCTCGKKGIIVEKCDALCPEDCCCGRKGTIVEKCDPLCPEDCGCGRKGTVVEKCDALCPVECCCGKEGIIAKKCDALCPEECGCGGHGVAVESNHLCSGDCCCQETGTQWEEPEGSKQKIAFTSMSVSKTKIKKKSKNKSLGSEKIKKNRKDKRGLKKKKNSKKTAGTTYSPNESSSSSHLNEMSSDKGYSGSTSTNSSSSSSMEGKKKQKIKPKTNKKSKSKKSISKGKKTKSKKQKQKDQVASSSYYISSVSGEMSTCDENYCSCAIQCPPMEAAHEESEEQCYSVTDYENSSHYSCYYYDLTSDFTAPDATVQHVYVERPRIRRVRRTNVKQRNQSVGTDAAIRDTVGTITEDWAVRKDVIYYDKPEIYRRRCKRDKCVSTKKLVSFRSRVQLIPSRYAYDFYDIYTPSRYLLESQRYYNELYSYPKYYSFKTSKKRF